MFGFFFITYLVVSEKTDHVFCPLLAVNATAGVFVQIQKIVPDFMSSLN